MAAIIETDVLVIGGGLAGCWAAIRASELACKVVLVDKAVVGRSGASVFTNSMLAPPEDEDIPEWRAEIAEAGTWFSDQEWVELLLKEQRRRVADLTSWGVPFERDSGVLATSLARGHKKGRVIMFNGHDLMDVMKRKIIEKGVCLKQRVMVWDLLTSDGTHPTHGRIIGAIGLDTRTADIVIFLAKSVVVATGIIESKFRAGYVNNLTGDGPAMAYRAGARIVGMEFCLNNHVNAFDRKYWTGGSSLLQGLGARFVDRDGKEFVLKYDPELGHRMKLSSLCLAFAKERFEGKGPVYLDMRSFSPEKLALVKKVLPTQCVPFERANIDLKNHLLEINPIVALCSIGQGGIKIDAWCQSSLPGLFAAGSAAYNLVHGTYAMGGINLAFCNVSGFLAGENAAKYSQQVTFQGPKESQVSALKQKLLKPLQNKGSQIPDQIIEDFHRIIMPASVSQFRTQASLRGALKQIESLSALTIFAPDEHELVKAHEASNLLLLSRLTLHAALIRQESRDSHYRRDFPYRDDVNWLKRIVISRRQDNDLFTEFDPVPIWCYPDRPKEFKIAPHPVQYLVKTKK